ncbi:MAG: prepilin-type N-terminal cleavage/methylation domain-containing protein [Actinomycetota bacterium]
MFDRLRKDEEGFTLIELLVVVIIIGILAAIAIPTFLNQREQAWVSQMESDLRNAATVQETLYASGNTYVTFAAATGAIDMDGDGATDFTTSTDVTLTGTSGDRNNFCINATHAATGEVRAWASATGGLQDVACV